MPFYQSGNFINMAKNHFKNVKILITANGLAPCRTSPRIYLRFKAKKTTASYSPVNSDRSMIWFWPLLLDLDKRWSTALLSLLWSFMAGPGRAWTPSYRSQRTLAGREFSALKHLFLPILHSHSPASEHLQLRSRVNENDSNREIRSIFSDFDWKL